MLVTTCLMSLVIVLCWQKSVPRNRLYFIFGTIEALYFTASLIKFLEKAWVSINWLLTVGPSIGIVRVRGIGLVQTELVSGIPAIFSHFVTNLPALHQVLVFLCIKSVPVPHVRPEERFLVGHIGPKEFRLYRYIVRYGYHDVHKDNIEFEKDLVFSIAKFVRSTSGSPTEANEDPENEGDKMTVVGTCSTHSDGIQMTPMVQTT
ncbi:hypothetical protein F3Y22_tig00117048pilonHSYRG00206 [Hibiscus syriacus]|uniref:K+ potassium transporter C-terminal domain-containing protein n=1 Tax=Hibiscus syriacus TaxID=106335 RepID=A0A6A2WBW9_HIBSY|nr:hypothetical protein F3Y22_tig00117048pilonHSYRG00206 [Hibiscus syriacus]